MDAHDGLPYPAFVAETVEGAQVVGYASLSAYNPKPGYRGTTENSVYVHPDWHGVGVGGALLSALLTEAARRGFVTLVALFSADTEASLRLHRRYGFQDVGTLRRAGRKFDRWVDVTFLQAFVDGQ
jgi:phosphinothricin acetyltransferase